MITGYCNSRGGHDTLGVGLILESEREKARSARVLRHLPCQALVSISAPRSLVHKEENLVKASDVVQVKLSDILKCIRLWDKFTSFKSLFRTNSN